MLFNGKPTDFRPAPKNVSETLLTTGCFFQTHRSAVAPVSSARGARTPGSTPSTNLTTPMESVRSSTHSLVPKRKKRNSFWCCVRSGKRNGDFYARLTVLQSITLSQIGERYYAPLLTKNPVRVSFLMKQCCVVNVAQSVCGPKIWQCSLCCFGLLQLIANCT